MPRKWRCYSPVLVAPSTADVVAFRRWLEQISRRWCGRFVTEMSLPHKLADVKFNPSRRKCREQRQHARNINKAFPPRPRYCGDDDIGDLPRICIGFSGCKARPI